MDKITILLVDDHAMMRDGIRALLELQEDMELVGEASEGKEAIKRVQELAVDVVIMDITMPGMDGLEATRRIRKKNSGVKILFLTQHDMEEYVILAIKAGANGYLPKRALGSELVSAIRAIHQGEYYLYPSATTALIKDYLQQTTGEPYDRLTAREREILKLIVEGYTSREIAKMSAINFKTVLSHRMNIMGKLNLRNHAELIRYAIRKRLVGGDVT